MAKAKNIATGTVSTSGSKTLTISGIGFKADHILIGLISPQFSGGTNIGERRVWTVFDNQMLYYGTKTENAQVTEIVFADDSVRITSANPYGSDQSKEFVGTYRYVAWQE